MKRKLAQLVVMVIGTWSLGRLLLANRQSLVVCLGRGRRGSNGGGGVCSGLAPLDRELARNDEGVES